MQRKVTIGGRDFGPEDQRVLDNLRALRNVGGMDVSLNDRAMTLLNVMRFDEETYAFGDRAALVQSLQALSAASPGRAVRSLPGQLSDAVFGTAIPRGVNKTTVLGGALAAGYRVFDTAETYGSFDNLLEAAKASGTALGDITVIHKIKPRNNTEQKFDMKDFSQRVRTEVARIPGEMRQLVMLHDLDASPAVNKQCLLQIYRSVAINGTSPNVDIGLSNVDIGQLTDLYAYCVQLGCLRIRLVQNRCSPYDMDLEVRRFCELRHIEYVAYGLFGSKAEGVCHEGIALPAHHLQALQDQRLIDLAQELKVQPGDLLLAWAKRKGVRAAMYSASHAADNYRALSMALAPETIAAIDGFFETKSAAVRSTYYAQVPRNVAALYDAVADATAWHILDTLMQMGGIVTLLDRLAGAIRAAHGAQGLRDFVYRLVRLVTHLQIVVAKEGTQDDFNWQMRLVTLFQEASTSADDKLAVARLAAWSQTPYMAVGGAAHAEEQFKDIVSDGAVPKVMNRGELTRFLLTAASVSDGSTTKPIPNALAELQALAGSLAVGNTITTLDHKVYRITKVQGERYTLVKT